MSERQGKAAFIRHVEPKMASFTEIRYEIIEKSVNSRESTLIRLLSYGQISFATTLSAQIGRITCTLSKVYKIISKFCQITPKTARLYSTKLRDSVFQLTQI
jgi:hypothetical protein